MEVLDSYDFRSTGFRLIGLTRDHPGMIQKDRKKNDPPGRGVGAWLGDEDRTPVPRERGSLHSVAVRHPETGHRVEDPSREQDLHSREQDLHSLASEGSTSHPSTKDRFVPVDGILHHGPPAVA